MFGSQYNQLFFKEEFHAWNKRKDMFLQKDFPDRTPFQFRGSAQYNLPTVISSTLGLKSYNSQCRQY